MGRLTIPADATWFVRSQPKSLIDHRAELLEQRERSEIDGFFIGKRGKRRPVVCLTMRDEVGNCRVFRSTTEAGRATKLAHQLIRRAAERGIRCGTHEWAYLEDLARAGRIRSVALSTATACVEPA
jgi:hypothetical protein